MYFWMHLGSLAVLIPVAAVAAFRVWPHTHFGRKAILAGPKPEEVLPFQEEERHLRQLIGKIGETDTVLNPAGMMRLGEDRLHCQSEGMILEPGTPVRVIAVQGNRVIVRRYVPPVDQPVSAEPSDPSPLDFDLA